MFSASQARTRAAKSSTDSVGSGADVVSVIRPTPVARLDSRLLLGERVDTQVVIFGGAEQRAVEHDSAQEQMKVVLPRHPDTAV